MSVVKNMKRLAIVSTHPVQYNAPLFRLLSEQLHGQLKVFYTWGESVLKNKFDPGFGKVIEWDIPLLQGYAYSFVNNISADPGSHSFKGINNPSLIKEIEQWKPTAVLLYGWNFKSHLQCIRYFHGKVPLLFRGDSTLIDQPGFIKNILRKILLRWVYKHIDIALYTGTHNKAYYKAFGLPEKQLLFAPHAVDNSRFEHIDEQQMLYAGALRKQLNIPGDHTVILYCGKFQHKKNPLLLLNVFKKMNVAKSHLLMVGDGELSEQLKIAAAGVDNIHFLPFQNQSQMPAVYRAGDIFCLPSQGPGETWGLAVNEAMACSKPVLVSDKTGCAPDLVKEGENGYVFSSNDAADLESKLGLLLNNRECLKQMGAASLHIIRSWSFGKTAAAITSVV